MFDTTRLPLFTYNVGFIINLDIIVNWNTSFRLMPQEDVLGPVLYVIYTEGLQLLFKFLSAPFYIYADNTQIFRYIEFSVEI